MNSLCVVGCQVCLNPGACSVCKTRYYFDSTRSATHYTCRTCSQAGKKGCHVYLQMVSDSSCQPCPIGYTGQNGVCVRSHDDVFSK
jgi:hypothetical protein